MADVNKLNVEGEEYDIADETARSGLTDGSVTKVGTSSVGNASRPMYLSSGTPTACSTTVGNASRPIYSSSGTLTACSTTVGGASTPIYSSSGTLTACSSTVGSSTTPVYMSAGQITACGSSLSDKADTSALTDGSVTKVGTASVGNASRPMYLSSGTPTACSTTVGGASKPIYSSSGTLTACSSTVGGATTPVYMNSGTITACSTSFDDIESEISDLNSALANYKHILSIQNVTLGSFGETIESGDFMNVGITFDRVSSDSTIFPLLRCYEWLTPSSIDVYKETFTIKLYNFSASPHSGTVEFTLLEIE